jgi:hypothetical protein
LGKLVGSATGFDLDASLHSMLFYYERSNYEHSNGSLVPTIEAYSITDQAITSHLGRNIEFDAGGQLPLLRIKDFPNEDGIFMLWELSISNDEHSRRFIPIFINDEKVLRPIAGKKIWDAILDDKSALTVLGTEQLSPETFEVLAAASRDYAYDAFVALKGETANRREESHRKYMYAINLRQEAAQRIGIENIRKHKLAHLANEKAVAERKYLSEKAIFPEFRPTLILRMGGSNA